MADETERESPSDSAPLEPEVPPLPRWIPALIASVLVLLGGLAVYTGLQYRTARVDRPVGQRKIATPPVERAGAPGEPQAGASHVLHGEMGENVPQPAPTDTQSSRVTIAGGSGSAVSTTIRYSARRGMLLKIEPQDASVYVNNQAMGAASQFNEPEEVYEFAEEGKFTVRLVAPTFVDETFVVNADPAAGDEVVTIRRTMKR